MRVSRPILLIEAVLSFVVGLLVAVAMQIIVFRIRGLQATLGPHLKLALVFTGVSIPAVMCSEGSSRRSRRDPGTPVFPCNRRADDRCASRVTSIRPLSP